MRAIKPILVTFKQNAVKESLFKQFRKKPTTANQLTSSFKPDRVYMNEYLPQAKRQLLAEIRKKTRGIIGKNYTATAKRTHATFVDSQKFSKSFYQEYHYVY